LSHGPPTPQGFFYDMAMPDGYVNTAHIRIRQC
jgi:threonyl-tRNA synthetase